ncbi:hypothetical protein ACXR2W_14210 [Leucobacter sp. HY1908]
MALAAILPDPDPRSPALLAQFGEFTVCIGARTTARQRQRHRSGTTAAQQRHGSGPAAAAARLWLIE